MSISLNNRVRKLERATPAAEQCRPLRWEMPESTRAVLCDGVRYERHQGESLEELTHRAAAGSSGPWAWVDAVE